MSNNLINQCKNRINTRCKIGSVATIYQNNSFSIDFEKHGADNK